MSKTFSLSVCYKCTNSFWHFKAFLRIFVFILWGRYRSQTCVVSFADPRLNHSANRPLSWPPEGCCGSLKNHAIVAGSAEKSRGAQYDFQQLGCWNKKCATLTKRPNLLYTGRLRWESPQVTRRLSKNPECWQVIKKRVIIQGSAENGGGRKRRRHRPLLARRFIKNLQPISVGVLRRLPWF